jgi:tetratricopeptide (TPR) repeat protein
VILPGGRSSARLFGFALVAMAMFVGSPAHADSRAELEKARASFLARNWTDAEERLRVLLDPKSGLKERSLISQARMYLGASLLAQGKKDDAKEEFEKLVLDDPTFDPDPLSFPGEAINTFIDVRSSLLEQIRNAQQTAARLAAEKKAREEAEREKQRIWLEKVKAQAAEEKITVRHNRIVASLPFGAGQFQNGQPVLGWVFVGAEVAAIAGTAVTYGMYVYARNRENDELRRPGGDVNRLVPQYHQRAEDLRIVNLSFAGAFVAVAALGIVQAHLAFVPESAEKRKRDLPPLGERPSLHRESAKTALGLSEIAPIVSPLSGNDGTPNGLFLGVRGFVF